MCDWDGGVGVQWPSEGSDASLLPCSHTFQLHVLRKAEQNLLDTHTAKTKLT